MRMISRITAKTREKYIWVCNLGHEWLLACDTKVLQNCQCPYCGNSKTLAGFNDLVTTHPDIAKEWSPNNTIKPSEVTFGSSTSVLWICPLGHEYSANISDRTRRNNGCSYCANKQVLVGFNDLQTTFPDIASEWDNIKNHPNIAQDTVWGSHNKAWWICSICQNSWYASIVNRTRRDRGCPRCNISKLEKKTSAILDSLSVEYEQEKTFIGCKYKSLLRFDFFLPKYQYCIECQGIQHYPDKFNKINNRWNINLDLIQKRDNIKREFCKNNDIKLIEIPYWKIENICEILQLELSL